ncbi:hypothetical protein AX14_000427 [Amanita brunnescens Koide BX004]|nr:hypothetical protein AX14_000427 [Amanita brunnescens Koide BX004]
MLSLHALLFFLLGTSIVAHPLPSSNVILPLLHSNYFARPSTWYREVDPSDQYSVEHRKDVIAFDPNKPLKLYALTENGEANEVHDIDGDQTQVLESIKGTWRLMPDISNANLRLYQMIVKPGEAQPFQIIQSSLITLALQLQYVDTPGSKPNGRLTGLWYQIPPNAQNYVIRIHEDGARTFYVLGPRGGKLREAKPRALVGTAWRRMPEADTEPIDRPDVLTIRSIEEGQKLLFTIKGYPKHQITAATQHQFGA